MAKILEFKKKEIIKKCVHTEHCCKNCGCKYGDEWCPVKDGNKSQSYRCGETGICKGY